MTDGPGLPAFGKAQVHGCWPIAADPGHPVGLRFAPLGSPEEWIGDASGLPAGRFTLIVTHTAAEAAGIVRGIALAGSNSVFAVAGRPGPEGLGLVMIRDVAQEPLSRAGPLDAAILLDLGAGLYIEPGAFERLAGQIAADERERRLRQQELDAWSEFSAWLRTGPGHWGIKARTSTAAILFRQPADRDPLELTGDPSKPAIGRWITPAGDHDAPAVVKAAGRHGATVTADSRNAVLVSLPVAPAGDPDETIGTAIERIEAAVIDIQAARRRVALERTVASLRDLDWVAKAARDLAAAGFGLVLPHQGRLVIAKASGKVIALSGVRTLGLERLRIARTAFEIDAPHTSLHRLRVMRLTEIGAALAAGAPVEAFEGHILPFEAIEEDRHGQTLKLSRNHDVDTGRPAPVPFAEMLAGIKPSIDARPKAVLTSYVTKAGMTDLSLGRRAGIGRSQDAYSLTIVASLVAGLGAVAPDGSIATSTLS